MCYELLSRAVLTLHDHSGQLPIKKTPLRHMVFGTKLAAQLETMPGHATLSSALSRAWDTTTDGLNERSEFKRSKPTGISYRSCKEAQRAVDLLSLRLFFRSGNYSSSDPRMVMSSDPKGGLELSGAYEKLGSVDVRPQVSRGSPALINSS